LKGSYKTNFSVIRLSFRVTVGLFQDGQDKDSRQAVGFDDPDQLWG